MSDKPPKLQVWSCGGGTQSCAIGALIVQGKLPKPDVAVIADTGRETRATWAFLDGILNPALEAVGSGVLRVTACEFGRIKDHLWINEEKAHHAMPIYSTETGSPVKLQNYCSNMWKGEVIRRWLSRRNITRSMHQTWIGFSRDEQRRIIGMQKSEDFQKGLIRFPLLEQGLTRRDCIALVESMGWGTPPRSACYMCPNHSDHEWRKLIAERPDEFQKAVELEREIRKVDPDAWLHRSCVPLDQVDFSQPEDLFSRPCDSGMCFV